MRKISNRSPSPSVLKPVEVRNTFIVSAGDNDGDHMFSVTASLLHGEVDIAVSFAGNDEGQQHIPARLIQKVQEAIEIVRGRVRPEDLIERDG